MLVSKKASDILDYDIDFQKQLIAEIITDKVFSEQIIDIIKPEYFKNNYFGFIIKLIQEYHKKHNVVPNYKGIRVQIDLMYAGTTDHKILIDTLESVQICEFNNLNVKEVALNFCKLQSVKNAVDKIHKKLYAGKYEDYDEIETVIKNSITFKSSDEGVPLGVGIEKALEDNYREPISTGIDGLDEAMNGGLGRGELGVIIAPLGVGKTTILTIFAATAYQLGLNVLHIFFEDKFEEVRRKYLAKYSGIELNELNSNRETVFSSFRKIEKETKGNIMLTKVVDPDVTTAKLRRIIKRERNKLGGKLDMVVLDYADCLAGDISSGIEEWKGEGKTMRDIERICEEFNVAFWTAVQGGRASLSANLVETNMIGGNIKKAQVAHFIMSIAKTLTQKDRKLATIAILKSRFGGDGKVFDDCTFDNSKLIINTTSVISADGFEKEQQQRSIERIRRIAEGHRVMDNNQNNEE